MTASPFALVIVNYGSHQLIADNVAGPVAEEGARVYVVDNPSSVAECQAVRQLCAERGWTLVASAANVGFGAGVNQGVRAAISDGLDVFVLLNPDAAADGPVLAGLARAVREDPGGVISPRVVGSDGHTDFDGAMVSLRTGRTRMRWIDSDGDGEWVNWLTGACMAFDRSTFEETGGFGEEYFLYWEDVDFSRRAVACGRHLAVRHDLLVVHDEGGTQGSQGRRAKSHSYYYWNCRNRVVFGRRFARVAWRDWLAATPSQSWQILLRGGRRQLLEDPGTFVAAVRGTLAGILVTARPHPHTREGRR
ncbi:glycosyltransferase family 2 protein [Acidipropionibacterium virtanenii]|uniref:N-acetylglucosaminyl-diphospho-decaprenol L-rhamnosyltransferase n=1 Tax=Acidipropionibacterium virtanenii TaxID=2057246 RepID=A0A344UWM9_9ACTN|nr:glycosyltransferase family 2 protein [Acidipropionibacterium virtanenii]AXE39677.1 N-acetylglucosaminyl-diphospho-decaprenol L-rhamnosyltransferase [Acidipropionibacterium virtanenii]